MLRGASKLTLGDQANLVVVIPGHRPLGVTNSHPKFEAICEIVEKQPEDTPLNEEQITQLYDLFDAASAAARRFNRLSRRVAVNGGVFYLDGDPVDNRLTKQVLRFLDEEVEDWEPLVNFFEKVQQNPSKNSREMLYDWVTRNDTIITSDGDLVLYKGVREADEDEDFYTNGEKLFYSQSSGNAVVNGEAVTGYVPNFVGAVVEMPRGAVVDNPNAACHTGLHCATFDFAKGFGSHAVLRITVHPADVVSTPNNANKVRVCRYVVEEVAVEPHEGSLYETEQDEPEVSAEEVRQAIRNRKTRQEFPVTKITKKYVYFEDPDNRYGGKRPLDGLTKSFQRIGF